MSNDFLGDILESAPDFSPSGKLSSQEAAPGLQYFRRVGKEEVGPYELAELEGLVREGKLKESDRIRRSDSAAWLTCRDLEELDIPSVENEHDLSESADLLDEMLAGAEDAPPAEDLPDLSDLDFADLPADPGDATAERHPKDWDVVGFDSTDLEIADFDGDFDISDLDANDLDVSDLEIGDLDVLDRDLSNPDVPESDLPMAPSDLEPPATEPAGKTEPRPTPSPVSKTPEPPKPALPAPLPIWSEADDEEAAAESAKKKSKAGKRLELPSGTLLSVLGGLALLWAVVTLWPRSDAAANRVAVGGTLSVDGEPISSGSISFVPATQTKGPSSTGVIENGEFHIEAAYGPGVGEYRMIVVIGDILGGSSQPTDKSSDSGPAISGQRFERMVTTKSEGENLIEFDFSSKEVKQSAKGRPRPGFNSSPARTPRR